ncbi:MAG: hypothetical protein IPK52_00415 [Chloroflexi bacterium]|nr:hypothetical protein [Chloroflexota bacterium]
MYGIKVQAFIDQHRPANVPITQEQHASTITQATAPSTYKRITALTPQPIRYGATICNGVVVYKAMPGYNGYYFDLRAFLKLCRELDIPYEFCIPLPEPIIYLPIPSWVLADDDDATVYGMFKSEAEGELQRFCTEAQQRLSLTG